MKTIERIVAGVKRESALISAATIAVLGALASFGVVSSVQQASVLAAVNAVLALAGGLAVRHVVYAPATVQKLVQQAVVTTAKKNLKIVACSHGK